MNLARYLAGCLKALGRSDGWEADFDLSRKGLKASFLAPLLSLPFYYVCAAAVLKNRRSLIDIDIGNFDPSESVAGLPTAAFFLIFALYAATFVVSVYLIAMIFERQDRFRPWVIVRHWSIFFAAMLAAIIMGLNMSGLLPFLIAIYSVMGIYLLTLAIDIRLAARIGGFEWGAATLTGCLITAMGLTVLMIGMAQFV